MLVLAFLVGNIIVDVYDSYRRRIK